MTDKSKNPRSLFHAEPEVINRWVRRKIIGYSKSVARFYMRPRIKWQERKRNQQLSDTISVVKERAFELQRTNFEASKFFFNIALFLLIAEKDLNAVKTDALTHPDFWKRNVALRNVLLIIYELDLSKVTGKRLKEAFDEAGVSKELRSNTYTILKKIRKAQAKAKKTISPLRNNTIAHRDANALNQYRMIKYLDEDKIHQIIRMFYEPLQEFHGVLPNLIETSGNLHSLARQFIRNGPA